MRLIFALLLLSGCCSTGLQVVPIEKPIPVAPVVLEYRGDSTVFDVAVSLDSIVRSDRTVVTRTVNFIAEADTVIEGRNGSARVWFKVDSQAKTVHLSAEVLPDSIPAGTMVPVVIKERPESFKERWFWVTFGVAVFWWAAFATIFIRLWRFK